MFYIAQKLPLYSGRPDFNISVCIPTPLNSLNLACTYVHSDENTLKHLVRLPIPSILAKTLPWYTNVTLFSKIQSPFIGPTPYLSNVHLESRTTVNNNKTTNKKRRGIELILMYFVYDQAFTSRRTLINLDHWQLVVVPMLAAMHDSSPPCSLITRRPKLVTAAQSSLEERSRSSI
jgi:hypothetical protein